MGGGNSNDTVPNAVLINNCSNTPMTNDHPSFADKLSLVVKPTQSGKTFELVESVKKNFDTTDLQVILVMNLLLNAEQAVARLVAGLGAERCGYVVVVASKWGRGGRGHQRSNGGDFAILRKSGEAGEAAEGEDPPQQKSSATSEDYSVVSSLKKLSSLLNQSATSRISPITSSSRPKVLVCLSNHWRLKEMYGLLDWIEAQARGGPTPATGVAKEWLSTREIGQEERFGIFRDVRSVILHHDELHNYIDWEVKRPTDRQSSPVSTNPATLATLVPVYDAFPSGVLAGSYGEATLSSGQRNATSLRTRIEEVCAYSVVQQIIGYTATPQSITGRVGVTSCSGKRRRGPAGWVSIRDAQIAAHPQWSAPKLEKLCGKTLEKLERNYHGTGAMDFVSVERGPKETVIEYLERVLRERMEELFRLDRGWRSDGTGASARERGEEHDDDPARAHGALSSPPIESRTPVAKPAKGNRIFAPAGIRKTTHTEIRDRIFEICPEAVVAMLNGDEKSLTWNEISPTSKYTLKSVSLARDAWPGLELAEKLEKVFDTHTELYSRHLVITGFLCLGMGQTFLTRKLGNFTHGILADRSQMGVEKQYQLCGRLTGMCRGWGEEDRAHKAGTGESIQKDAPPTVATTTTGPGFYTNTRVYCPESVQKIFHEMEKEVLREMYRAVTEENPRLGGSSNPP